MAWSLQVDLTTERFKTNLQLLLLVWLIWQTVRDLRQLRILLQGFVIGSCIAVILTMINSSQNLRAVDSIRYAGAGADPNELGLTLVITMPISYYLFTTARSLLGRLFWLFPIPFCVLGVVLTVSRGALITTVIALLGISCWHFMTSRQMRFAPLLAAALLLIIGLASVPKADLARYATIEDEVSTGRVGQRTRIWTAGMQMFQERPMTGVGAATFGYGVEPILGRDLVAHNVYISILTETGIIGFAIFLFALLSLFFIISARLFAREQFLWGIVMLIWCIGVLSLTWEYKKISWSIFALIIATAGATFQRNSARNSYLRAA